MDTTDRTARVLVVGSDECRTALDQELTASLTVEAAESLAAAERRVASDDVACVVTATETPDTTGLEVAETVRGIDPDLPVVLVASADNVSAVEATEAGVTAVVPTTANAGALAARVDEAVETYRRRRKQARDSDMFTSMLETLPVALYVKDRAGRHLRLADVPGGADPEEARGRTDPEIYDHDVAQQTLEDDLQVVETGEPIEQQPEMHSTAEMPGYYETTKVPWRDDDGTVKGVLGVTYDVTHLKETERSLRRRVRRLEEFASYVAHDVRTPLQLAHGKLDLADAYLSEGDPEQARTAVEAASEALTRIDELVADLQDVAHANEEETDHGHVPLARVVESVWDRLRTDEATLECAVPETARLYGVESHLYPFFENLFKNAIEHAGPAPSVRVRLTDDGFAVADDGPGIPPDERSLVTQPGYTTDTDGTGTGLEIVSDIAHLHDWRIDVEESPAGGAQFSFENCLLVAEPPGKVAESETLDLQDHTDVGDVDVSGDATYDPETDRWTVAGAGEDLWQDVNEFHYVYRHVAEPVRLTASVADVERTDDYSKAGIMIRDDLTEDATFGYVGRTPAVGSEVLWRSTGGSLSVSQQFDPDGAEPRYRLTHNAGRVTASQWVDGEWLAIDQRPVPTDGGLTVGLAVCSVTPRYRCEAVFQDVTVETLAE